MHEDDKPRLEFESGDLVWWKYYSDRKDWDCPGKVTSTDNESVTIQSYDDMTYTTVGRTSYSSMIRIAHAGEVRRYLLEKAGRYEVQALEFKQKMESAQLSAVECRELATALLR